MDQNQEPSAASPPTNEGSAGEISNDEKNMGMLCHLLGLLSFIGPLIIWLLKKDESKFIDDNGKEALNFQITIALAYVVSMFLMFVVIGILLMPVVMILWFVFTIIGAVKTSEGKSYRYPLTIRLLK